MVSCGYSLVRLLTGLRCQWGCGCYGNGIGGRGWRGFVGQECERDGHDDEEKGHAVIPAKGLLEVCHEETAEDEQGDDFLHDLELRGGEAGAAPAVGGDLKAILEEGDEPTDEDNLPEGGVFVAEMAVPGDGHEEIAGGEEQDGLHRGMIVGGGAASDGARSRCTRIGAETSGIMQVSREGLPVSRGIRWWVAFGVSFCAAIARGDVFHLSGGLVSVEFVRVGDAGNPADAATGTGAVAYAYDIGRYEVTIGQYAEFLNAVAADDTYGMYHAFMGSHENIKGIIRDGSPGTYHYSLTGSPNRPIAYATWGDAARFCNWLQNGQPSGAQNAGTTEDGSYFLNGANTNSSLTTIPRKAGARFVLPTTDEWYKAAYYDPTPGAGGGDSYWGYPVRSDAVPFSAMPPGSAAPIASRAANFRRDDQLANGFNDGFAVTGTPVYSAGVNYLTDVGAYASAASYYGAFDMAGGVAEWTEGVLASVIREFRGGSWNGTEFSFRATVRGGDGPALPSLEVGFRVVDLSASLPCALIGDVSGDGAVNGDDVAGFVRVKLGAPSAGDRENCAAYGTGSAAGDAAAFAADLLD